jgi:hypothetical protein
MDGNLSFTVASRGSPTALSPKYKKRSDAPAAAPTNPVPRQNKVEGLGGVPCIPRFFRGKP